ncbi:hypothetical protein M569_07840, partial [Genlisea aurea]
VSPIPGILSWLGRFSSRTRCLRFIRRRCRSSYEDRFSRRMSMAGLKPHHRIAIAVSGGPDSVALCILTAGWKCGNHDASTSLRSNPVDGLLAVVVDHGLRNESAEEAHIVSGRITDMGIKCEVARCQWSEGRPKVGHLQEAARNKRYDILQSICLREKFGVLLVAHHSDDQAELFILRLSRNSGVLGLAGMPFVSEIFPECPDLCEEGSKTHGILLVRPLLDFTKEDLYDICRIFGRQWVEDPTNVSPLFARNRIRMSLKNLSSADKAELSKVISECRKIRLDVEKRCQALLSDTVEIVHHGYAVVDLQLLLTMEVDDICLARFIVLLLQFISQRHRPIRGNALKVLLSYFRTTPCKTCLAAAGCYLRPAPGSKGSKLLVCCCVDACLPPTTKPFSPRNGLNSEESEQIIAESNGNLDRSTPDDTRLSFEFSESGESVLRKSLMLGILSASTHEAVISIQKEETESFKSRNGETGEDNKRKHLDPEKKPLLLRGGEAGLYWMNRFAVEWKCSKKYRCCDCLVSNDVVDVILREMRDVDWIYVYDLAEKREKKNGIAEAEAAVISAERAAVQRLKSIPVCVRRCMPVLVDEDGVLLSIP